MKNLFYKEMKLCFHPIIIVLLAFIPFFVIVPYTSSFMSLAYIAIAYPILFLGANKGQQSNDIFFSCLLPIRKKDVVLGRMMVTSFIQIIALVGMTIGVLLRDSFFGALLLEEEGLTQNDFGSLGAFSLLGICLVIISIFDLIYFLCFYRNGRSVVMGTLLGVAEIGFLSVGIITVPSVMSVEYIEFFTQPIVQIITLAIGVGTWFGLHALTLNLSTKLLEKVDF